MKLDRAFVRSALGGSPARAPHPGPWAEGIRPAAVVVPVHFEPEPMVSFVLRAAHLSSHAGEIAFPGGKPEPGEELVETALREAEEEVGLRRDDFELLGTLTPVPVITGAFLIHPFVMAVRAGAAARPASGEVERVLQTRVFAWLFGELRRSAYPVEWRGNRIHMPEFSIGGRTLFGATAIVFNELLVRLADGVGTDLPEPHSLDKPAWER